VASPSSSSSWWAGTSSLYQLTGGARTEVFIPFAGARLNSPELLLPRSTVRRRPTVEEAEQTLRSVLSRHQGSVAIVPPCQVAAPLRLAGTPADFAWLSVVVEKLGARGVEVDGAVWLLEGVEWRKKMKRFVFVRASALNSRS